MTVIWFAAFKIRMFWLIKSLFLFKIKNPLFTHETWWLTNLNWPWAKLSSDIWIFLYRGSDMRLTSSFSCQCVHTLTHTHTHTHTHKHTGVYMHTKEHPIKTNTKCQRESREILTCRTHFTHFMLKGDETKPLNLTEILRTANNILTKNSKFWHQNLKKFLKIHSITAGRHNSLSLSRIRIFKRIMMDTKLLWGQ